LPPRPRTLIIRKKGQSIGEPVNKWQRGRPAELAAKVIQPESRSPGIEEATSVKRVIDPQVPDVPSQMGGSRLHGGIDDSACTAAQVGLIVRCYERELLERVRIRKRRQGLVVFVVVVISSFDVEANRRAPRAPHCDPCDVQSRERAKRRIRRHSRNKERQRL